MATVGVPFYDTENVVVKPTERTWVTVEWMQGTTARMDFCTMRENGFINVVFIGRAGVGDTELLTAGEAAMDLLMANIDVTGLLVLNRQGVPDVFSDNMGHFCVGFPVEYDYQG